MYISGEPIRGGGGTVASAPGAAPKSALPYVPSEKGLTSTQVQLLREAAARRDGVIVFPERFRGRIVRQIAGSLLDRGLAKEVAPKAGVKAWRNDADGAFALALTPTGRKAVRDFNAAAGELVRRRRGGARLASDGEAQAIDTRAEKAAPDTSAAGQAGHGVSAREGSKIARVLALLQRPEGATMDDLVQETGWLVHTTRAALTGLRKRGHVVETMRGKDGTVWRIGQIESRDA